jgi:hypothetical protein
VVYVVLNVGDKPETAEIPVFYRTKYYDCISGEEWAADGMGAREYCNSDMWDYQGVLRLEVEPYGVKILRRRNLV